MGTMVHFLQRPAWAKFQNAIGRVQVADEGDGWQYQAFLERGKLGARLYVPYGPVLDDPKALAPAIKSLKDAAKKMGAAFVRFEPTGNVTNTDIAALGLKRVTAKQPEHTQRIDIDRPFAEVLAEMKSSLRNRHRNYHKKGLSVRSSNDPADVEHLIRLMAQVATRNDMLPHSDEYLRDNAKHLMPEGAALMYLAELDGEVIAASLTFEDEDCRYYAHAAADTEHRSLHAGAILVSQMIADATEGPQKFFDLYGVVPESEKDHPWFGFSEFKRSFGGQQVDYAGTYEIPVRRVHYELIRLVRKFFGSAV